MRSEQTQQQHDLQASCPHQNWIDIDLSQYDYYVRRSLVNPREQGFASEAEPAETNSFRRPTPALKRSWEIATAYREQGYRVVKDVQWGVHQLSKNGEQTFFLFIEYREKRSGASVQDVVANLDKSRRSVGEEEKVATSIRLDKQMLKVLKAMSELREEPLSDLLEGIVHSSLFGSDAFSRSERRHIAQLCEIYEVRPKANTE